MREHILGHGTPPICIEAACLKYPTARDAYIMAYFYTRRAFDLRLAVGYPVRPKRFHASRPSLLNSEIISEILVQNSTLRLTLRLRNDQERQGLITDDQEVLAQYPLLSIELTNGSKKWLGMEKRRLAPPIGSQSIGQGFESPILHETESRPQGRLSVLIRRIGNSNRKLRSELARTRRTDAPRGDGGARTRREETEAGWSPETRSRGAEAESPILHFSWPAERRAFFMVENRGCRSAPARTTIDPTRQPARRDGFEPSERRARCPGLLVLREALPALADSCFQLRLSVSMRQSAPSPSSSMLSYHASSVRPKPLGSGLKSHPSAPP